MKVNKFNIIIGLACSLLLSSCNDIWEDNIEIKPYKDEYATLYSFLEDNADYSYFKMIVDAALIDGSDQSMASVYQSVNPNDNKARYTLFLPGNQVVEEYLSSKDITLEMLLADPKDCWNLSTHHLINSQYTSNNFPNGAFEALSLNGASHTIQYQSTDSGVVYLLDETASVLIEDLEQTNGIIHIINKVLEPLSYSSCDWLSEHEEFSIFVDALKLTGLFDRLQKIDTKTVPFTMFIEADSIYKKEGIFNVQDLVERISPTDNDYTGFKNPLYQFVAYHIVDNNMYLADFIQSASLPTYATYPLNIIIDAGNSESKDYIAGIRINKGAMVFDTIISRSNDTIIIDYISIFQEGSNKATLSGPLHFINYVLEVDTNLVPSVKQFNFTEDLILNDARVNKEPNEYHQFTEQELSKFEFGGDLQYLSYFWSDNPETEMAMNQDYIFIFGNYECSYTTSKIAGGNYLLGFNINAKWSTGFINVFIDDKQVGGTINLTAWEPENKTTLYRLIDVGYFKIDGYSEHKITIKAVTTGYFYLDMIQFAPL